jgi:glycosyltransferase involved in cell wall biosynthesis
VVSAQVTVGLPVFNGEPYLAETIESVLGQDHGDFTLIISDNGSTDATEPICRHYAAQDERVSYHRSERNLGAAWNYNRLVQMAESTYFRWQAADDAIRPSFLAECVRVLESSTDVVLCYTPAQYIDADGERLKVMRNPAGYAEGQAAGARVRSVLRTSTHCFEVFGLIRRSELVKTRLIGSYPGSDLVLLAELAMLGRFVQLSEPLFVHRMHAHRSVFQYEDRRDLVRWYQPDAVRLTAPQWRLLREHVHAFRALPVPISVRAAAILEMIPWSVRHRNRLAFDVATAMPTPVPDLARKARDRRRLRGK